MHNVHTYVRALYVRWNNVHTYIHTYVRAYYICILVGFTSKRRIITVGPRIRCVCQWTISRHCAHTYTDDDGLSVCADGRAGGEQRQQQRIVGGPSHPHSQVLWPFLLEFVKPMEYTEAFGILTRCIAHIGGKKRDSDADDYFINFDEQGELRIFFAGDGVLWHVARVLWA